MGTRMKLYCRLGILLLFISVVSISVVSVAAQAGQAPEGDGQAMQEPTATVHIVANGQLIASKQGGALSFHAGDNLGTNRFTADATGSLRSKSVTYPFGKTLEDYSFASSRQKFLYTGKERDRERFYYYGARYYNPSISRFISSDTILDDETSPYAYVKNNPLYYIDPTGAQATVAAQSFQSVAPQAMAFGPFIATGIIVVAMMLDYYEQMNQMAQPVDVPVGLPQSPAEKALRMGEMLMNSQAKTAPNDVKTAADAQKTKEQAAKQDSKNQLKEDELKNSKKPSKSQKKHEQDVDKSRQPPDPDKPITNKGKIVRGVLEVMRIIKDLF